MKIAPECSLQSPHFQNWLDSKLQCYERVEIDNLSVNMRVNIINLFTFLYSS